MKLAKRLKQLRLENNLTQTELGKKVNVTKVSISGYETGNRKPDIDTLYKLASVFSVSVDDLLGLDYKLISEEPDAYSMIVPKEDIMILSEIKKYPKVYSKLCDNLENTVKLIDKKIN